MDCSTAGLLGMPREIPYTILHGRAPARARRDRSKLRIAHFDMVRSSLLPYLREEYRKDCPSLIPINSHILRFLSIQSQAT